MQTDDRALPPETAETEPTLDAACPRLSLAHRAWRRLPKQARRAVLARTLAAIAPRIRRPAPEIAGRVALAGEFGRPSGLGRGARVMLAALERLGIPCWPIETGGDRTLGDPAGRQDHRPAAGAALVAHVQPPLLPLALRRLRPTLGDCRMIGYWAWELPQPPQAWRFAARALHEIWTPSQFSADALQPLLPGHVRVVPHPLAVAERPVAAMGRAAFGLPADTVIVLASCGLASALERKNPFGALAAFQAAFGARRDRFLVLKVTDAAHDADAFAGLRAAIGSAPNIRLETRVLSDAADRALIACADIVLSLHRSEGFGLVTAEAMLLGRAVVATGWSGNLQYMDAGSASLVDYRMVAARDARAIYAVPGACWAEPELDDAVARLRLLADDPEARMALGERAQACASTRLDGRELIAALGGDRSRAA